MDLPYGFRKARNWSGAEVLGGLAPDERYYIRLYAENSVGYDWTGKEFVIRTQAKKFDLPITLALWLDSTDLNNDEGLTSNYNEESWALDGQNINYWKDKSGRGRDLPSSLTRGSPSIKLEGAGGKPVVTFDGKSQMVSDYNFRGADLNLWRNEGYSAFGVSRYTGGDSERVISSAGQNWLFGHHGNQIGRYYFNGWVDQGFESDTNFHIFETLHEGRSVSTDPSSTVWTDAIEGSYRSGGKNRSSNWNFFPDKLSFGAWSSLSEASKCQVAEFLIFEGLLDEGDRLKIEGYLAHKWAIPLPSSHPWANDPPSFGQEIISGSTPVIDTNRTFVPSVVNRTPANLKNTSASLTGRIINTGLGVLPFNPVGEVATTFSQTPGLSPPVLGDLNVTNISQSSAN